MPRVAPGVPAGAVGVPMLAFVGIEREVGASAVVEPEAAEDEEATAEVLLPATEVMMPSEGPCTSRPVALK